MQHGEWVQKLNQYEGADIYKSVTQMLVTSVPYFLLIFTMLYLVHNGYRYWTVLLLAPLASLFFVRIFLIMHDCSHKSYWRRSPLASFIIGHICGIITFMAFFDFRQGHVIHHATVANLDKRGEGDVWTMTVNEYKASSVLEKDRLPDIPQPVRAFRGRSGAEIFNFKPVPERRHARQDFLEHYIYRYNDSFDNFHGPLYRRHQAVPGRSTACRYPGVQFRYLDIFHQPQF